jgi:hypothetical protein
MTEKIYPMYDDYHQAEAQLQELKDAREMVRESLKTAHPSRLAEGYILLKNANERIEAALAREYEAHQQACRSREEYEKLLDELEEGVYAGYIYLKHRRPEAFKRVQAAWYQNRTPEEIEELEACIAHLEATRLEEFIGTD